MNRSSMYSKLARTAATSVLVALASSAMFFATSSQARPVYVNDGGFIQGPQLVISPPQLVVAPPVYVHPARPAQVRPVVVYPPAYPVTHPVTYRPGRVYYIHGRPYLNGHPYRAQFHHRGNDRHHDRHDGRRDEGRHLGHNR